MNSYKLGTTVRFSSSVTLLGVLTNPEAVSLLLQPPGSATITFSSPTNDGAGLYHQDYTLPSPPSTLIGIWKYRWMASGVGESGLGEGFILVSAPSF
jgi:hypothetical protein